MVSTLEQRICASLIADWGYVMGGAGLRQALGFASQPALRAAISGGRLPIRTFTIAGRRGHFALTHDVATWLAAQSRDLPPTA
jgi:hypothetical protein